MTATARPEPTDDQVASAAECLAAAFPAMSLETAIATVRATHHAFAEAAAEASTLIEEPTHHVRRHRPTYWAFQGAGR